MARLAWQEAPGGGMAEAATPMTHADQQQVLAACSATAGVQQPDALAMACAISWALSGAQQAPPSALVAALSAPSLAFADASTLLAGTWRILSASAMASPI